MVFSFNFSPIVSSFVVSKREEYEKDFGRDFTERKCSQIISRASMLMVAVVMFFAFSCLFTLSPANMAEAKAQNIPVLSYLANHFASMTGTKTTFAITLEYAASIIASLLCLLPMYAIRKAPSLAKYRGRLDNVFVTVIGLLTILNIVYKLF